MLQSLFTRFRSVHARILLRARTVVLLAAVLKVLAVNALAAMKGRSIIPCADRPLFDDLVSARYAGQLHSDAAG